MDSLDSLETSDPDIDFLLIVNGGEILYASDKEREKELSREEGERLQNLAESRVMTQTARFTQRRAPRSLT